MINRLPFLGLSLALFLSFALPAFKAVECAAADSLLVDWQPVHQRAERFAQDLSFRDRRAVWQGDSARSLLIELLAADSRNRTLNDSARYVLHLALGDYYCRDGYRDEALSHWLNCDQLAKPLWPANSDEHRNLLWRLSILARGDGDIAAADSLESLALSDTTVESAAQSRLGRLRELAKILIRLIKIEQAWKVHEQIVREWRRTPVGDAQAVVIALMDLAEGASKLTFTNFQMQRTAQDSAVRLGYEALAIARQSLGEEATTVGYVLNRLGDYCRRQGDDAAAESCWQQAYAINSKTRSEADIETQGSIARIGGLCVARGDYSRAEQLLTKAVELRKQTQGDDHQEVAAMLSGLASLYRQTGRFARAESLLTQSLSIRCRALPPTHPDIAANLNALGRVCFDRGSLAAAESHWLDALSRFESVLGGNDAATVAVRQNLASLYVEWGREGDALAMYKAVLAARRNFLGEDHPAVIASLVQIADLHLQLDQVNEAERAIDEARRLMLSRGGALSRDLVLAEANLLSHRRLFRESDSLLTLIVAQIAETHGDSSIVLMDPLQRLAANKSAQHDFWAADSLLKILEQVALQNGVTATPQFAEALQLHGDALHALGSDSAAFSLYRQSFAISEASFHDGIAVLPERQAIEFGRKLRKIRDRCLSVLVDRHAPVAAIPTTRRPDSQLPDEQQRFLLKLTGTKSAIQDIAYRRRCLYNSTCGGEAQVLLDSLTDISLGLSRLYLTVALDTSAVGMDGRIRRLATAKDILEARLSRTKCAIQDDDWRDPAFADSLFASLGDHHAGVDFVRFERFRPDHANSIPCYAAIVAQQQEVSLLNLGPAARIDRAIDSLQRHFQELSRNGGLITDAALREYRDRSRRLRELVWSPFARLVETVGKIYVSPDAVLNAISFAALPEGDNSYLVENHDIAYVNALRDIWRDPAAAVLDGRLLSVGDPDFESSSKPPTANAEHASSIVSRDGSAIASTRSSSPRCPFAKAEVLSLPASRYEATAVADFWQRSNGRFATSLLGREATEEQFKALAPACDVLHIATHAYRWDAGCLSGVAQSVAKEHPHLLTGLLLAGAASRQREDAASALDDGILTAEEISNLNLHKARLVVLSACESGLGEFIAGEGVLGLRRAFQVAGARSVVTSLWEISDQSTARLMRYLYEGLSDGVQPALRDAQLRMLKSQRLSGVPDHPYSWGAFVAFGS